jgi:hypothetical protein
MKNIFSLFLFSLAFSSSVSANAVDFEKANYICKNAPTKTVVAVDTTAQKVWIGKLNASNKPVASTVSELIVKDWKTFRCPGCFEIVASSVKARDPGYKLLMRGEFGRELIVKLRLFRLPNKELFETVCESN